VTHEVGAGADTGPGAGAPLRVVVVDDTPDLRDLLTMALQRRGEYAVVAEAENGREAIDVVRAHQPDLVLLDIAMPVMDGLEALPHIRQAATSATVVMLSGFNAAEMTERAVALGADGYVQKGTPIRQLLEQVRGHLERSAAARGSRVPPPVAGGEGLPRRAAQPVAED
jgi:DNA-binding NarL/FixJ family response regulator